MEDIKFEKGNHIDERTNVTYVVQIIKFKDRSFDSGTVVKEFILEKGKKTILQFNVR